MPSTDPFPLMPPRSTEARLAHFDEYVYRGDSGSLLYRLVDALCGTAGAGSLINEVFLARLSGAMQTIFFNELDFVFGKIQFLARSPAESYPYNPMADMLTSDEWDEVRVKDAWYRARLVDFFQACTLGGTPNGIRMAVQAAVAVDCDIYEVWRYKDNFGITADLGRSPHTARNEVVIRPHKDSLAPEESRLLRDMLDKIGPLDTIYTVNTSGLAVSSPVSVNAAAASGSYFEVEKMVTASPIFDQLPPPEKLRIHLHPTEKWLFKAKKNPVRAPHCAFNKTQEYGYWHLVGGGKRSPIDSVSYGTIHATHPDPMSTFRGEADYKIFDTTEQFTDPIPWEKADCPDNYPGGKYGVHSAYLPAVNPDGSPYTFPYPTQAAFVIAETLRIEALGGLANSLSYQLPIQTRSSAGRAFPPENAIASTAPAKESTVSISITQRRSDPRGLRTPEARDPINFVRKS